MRINFTCCKNIDSAVDVRVTNHDFLYDNLITKALYQGIVT